MREKNKAPRKSEVQESTQNIEDDFRDMMPTSEEFHAVEYVEPSEEFYAVRYTEPGGKGKSFARDLARFGLLFARGGRWND